MNLYNIDLKGLITRYKYLVSFIVILIVTAVIIQKYIHDNVINKGIQRDSIIFGQTLPLTGPLKNYGLSYNLGYILAFQSVNRKNGVNGKRIEIITYDDEYNPKYAMENVQILNEYFDLFAIVGTVGTATTAAISKYLVDRNLLLLQPYTGSSTIRGVFSENIIHTRASYYDEIAVIVDMILKNKIKNVSVFYQNDSYGLSTLDDLDYYINKKNLNRHFNIISKGNYERDSYFIEDAIKSILQVNHIYDLNDVRKSEHLRKLEAVITIGNSAQTCELIKYLKNLKPDIYIMCISPSNIDDIEKDLITFDKSKLTNIYSTQVVPQLKISHPTIYNKLLEEIGFMKQKTTYVQVVHDYTINNIMIEGFLNGLFIIELLKKMGDNITRDSLKKTLYNNRHIEVDGIKYGPFYKPATCTDLQLPVDECPCNVGYRYVYICKYNISSKKFEYVKNTGQKSSCNRY